MPKTVPNQRVVKIHRERATADFLGIKNENWQAAARDLGAHAVLLYMYFASNRDGYTLALSPAAIRQAIGMPPQTYRDQFIKLLDKGYLVQQKGNLYAFYEKPQKADKKENTETNDVLDFDLTQNDMSAVLDNTPVVLAKAPAVQLGTETNIEINTNNINNNINNDGLLVKQVSPTPKKSKFVF